MEEEKERKQPKEAERLRKMKGKRDEVGGWDRETMIEERHREERE